MDFFGLIIALIIVVIEFQEPVLDYYADLLYYPGGEMQYAYMGALFS